MSATLLARWGVHGQGYAPILFAPAVAAAFEHLKPALQPGAVALDVGSGPGNAVAAFAATGAHAVGVEPDARTLAEARRTHRFAAFVAGQAERLPLPDGSVDALFCCSVLQYTDRGAALAEFARVLRPGGRYAVIENLRDNLAAGAYRAWRRLSGAVDPPNMVPRDRIRWTERHRYAEHFRTAEFQVFHLLAPGLAIAPALHRPLAAPPSPALRLYRVVRRLDDALLRAFPAGGWHLLVYGIR